MSTLEHVYILAEPPKIVRIRINLAYLWFEFEFYPLKKLNFDLKMNSTLIIQIFLTNLFETMHLYFICWEIHEPRGFILGNLIYFLFKYLNNLFLFFTLFYLFFHFIYLFLQGHVLTSRKCTTYFLFCFFVFFRKDLFFSVEYEF